MKETCKCGDCQRARKALGEAVPCRSSRTGYVWREYVKGDKEYKTLLHLSLDKVPVGLWLQHAGAKAGLRLEQGWHSVPSVRGAPSPNPHQPIHRISHYCQDGRMSFCGQVVLSAHYVEPPRPDDPQCRLCLLALDGKWRKEDLPEGVYE